MMLTNCFSHVTTGIEDKSSTGSRSVPPFILSCLLHSLKMSSGGPWCLFHVDTPAFCLFPCDALRTLLSPDGACKRYIPRSTSQNRYIFIIILSFLGYFMIVNWGKKLLHVRRAQTERKGETSAKVSNLLCKLFPELPAEFTLLLSYCAILLTVY